MRKENNRKLGSNVFIFVHTNNTEHTYFTFLKNRLPLNKHLLKISKIIDGSPWEFLNNLKKSIPKLSGYSKEDDVIWAIFDVDDFYNRNSRNFLDSIVNAKKNKIKMGISNPCIEFWFLLHFKYTSSKINSKETIKELNKILNYEKDLNKEMLNLLLENKDNAIKNIKKLIKELYPNFKISDSYDDNENNFYKDILSKNGNPITTLHLLIKDIEINCNKLNLK